MRTFTQHMCRICKSTIVDEVGSNLNADWLLLYNLDGAPGHYCPKHADAALKAATHEGQPEESLAVMHRALHLAAQGEGDEVRKHLEAAVRELGEGIRKRRAKEPG